ncbi:hypothetical protein GCM10009548_93330 [Streptomyces malaysiensis subsp. malaysiensis]|uniref:Tyr recombinase domain-containing protein n=1 Tax=Streptomyces malaysiensis TaxID=92644 RepID=A0ABX6WAA8_STRMQ|nr:hypothetical protein I1A49_24320 [Streptomyces solisilvae]
MDLETVGVWVRRVAPELTTGRRGVGDTKSEAKKWFIVLPGFMRKDLERHVKWFAEKEPNGLLFVGEKGAPFRRSTFGRKWWKPRAKVGLPENFRFYDLRHTGHTLSTQSGVTLKDTMMRVGQPSTRAALIYQHSPLERQKEVSAGIDVLWRADRLKGAEQGGSGARRPAQVGRQQTTNKPRADGLGLCVGASDGN